ncbi:MAG: hypothetical protein H6732_16850 [Alphaproteobacteria bacterium]|nr:hypothetical protein [Alphaproteobacteria bacterium]
MSNGDEGWAAPNQQHPPARQLEDGVRGMLLDTYEDGGELVLCHGYCELGRTPLADVLGQIRDFLEASPGELVAIIFQDAISPEQTLGALASAGLDELLITPPADGVAWPTLGELVAADTRLLVTRESGGEGPAVYRSFWDLGWDTPYSFRSEEEFSCAPNRGDPSHDLFLLNHWLSTPLPSRRAAERVNTAEVLGARARACTDAAGRPPTLLAVDFHDTGALFEVVDELNDAAVAGFAPPDATPPRSP